MGFINSWSGSPWQTSKTSKLESVPRRDNSAKKNGVITITLRSEPDQSVCFTFHNLYISLIQKQSFFLFLRITLVQVRVHFLDFLAPLEFCFFERTISPDSQRIPWIWRYYEGTKSPSTMTRGPLDEPTTQAGWNLGLFQTHQTHCHRILWYQVAAWHFILVWMEAIA